MVTERYLKHKTPFLLIDRQQISKDIVDIKRNLPDFSIYYAMKANDNVEVLETVKKHGVGFEVASEKELKILLKIGVSPKKIICLNTIKSPSFIRLLKKFKVDVLAVDSEYEIDKIKKIFPNAKLVVRVIIPNSGSLYSLDSSDKFGVHMDQVVSMFEYIKNNGLNPYGITFHVGSQNYNLESWDRAIKSTAKIMKELRSSNIKLKFMSLGGGLPIEYSDKKDIPSIKQIGDIIEKSAIRNFKFGKDFNMSIEPGRGIVGRSGTLVTTVIGKSLRSGKRWLYTDVGVFNGLMETVGGFIHKLTTEKDDQKKFLTNVGGPTCDSFDVPYEDYYLPDLEIGDKIFIENSGAYTNTFASEFNGFSKPKILFID